MKKIVLWIIVILVLGGLGYGLWLWNKPHRDIAGEEAKYELQAAELVEAFSGDEQAANTKYVNQVVELNGIVSESAADHIKLESGVYCKGDFSASNLELGSEVAVKGRVISYDELFGEVRLDHCTLN